MPLLLLLGFYHSLSQWIDDRFSFQRYSKMGYPAFTLQLSSLSLAQTSGSRGQVILKPSHAYYDEYYSYKGFVRHWLFFTWGLSRAVPQAGKSWNLHVRCWKTMLLLKHVGTAPQHGAVSKFTLCKSLFFHGAIYVRWTAGPRGIQDGMTPNLGASDWFVLSNKNQVFFNYTRERSPSLQDFFGLGDFFSQLGDCKWKPCAATWGCTNKSDQLGTSATRVASLLYWEDLGNGWEWDMTMYFFLCSHHHHECSITITIIITAIASIVTIIALLLLSSSSSLLSSPSPKKLLAIDHLSLSSFKAATVFVAHWVWSRFPLIFCWHYPPPKR